MTARLLVDIRETEHIRGFHALAALAMIGSRLRQVALFGIGGDDPNERIARLSFSHDTGLPLRAFRPNARRVRFDAFLCVADSLPTDPISIIARNAARTTLAALLFDCSRSQPSLIGRVVSGHDTAEIALGVLDALGLSEGEQLS